MGGRHGYRLWTHKEIAVLRAAYGTLSLAEIGRLVDRPPHKVMHKAIHLGIARKRFRMDAKAEVELTRLVGLGYSDRDIAAELGTNKHTVREHRHRLGLPSQRYNARHRRKLAEKTRQQCQVDGVSSLVEIRWLKRRIGAIRGKGRTEAP